MNPDLFYGILYNTNNMKKITLNKNYNPYTDNNATSAYKDHLFETISEIKMALDGGKITEEAANALMQILIVREAKNESAELIRWMNQNNKEENTSVFINISHNNREYV